MNQGPLPPVQLTWDAQTPKATDFGDIYFNPEDGLAETHHVFLQGNDLPNAWAERSHYTIGELGFGTGLNILATWQLWRKTKPDAGNLHIISVEGYPLDSQQMEQAHAAFPELAKLSSKLRNHLPPRARGHHLVMLEEDVTLHLLYGHAADVLSRFEGSVDAWFLDGFAPAKNEAMWSPALMEQIARCSAPGASLASFTVAGDVRRALQAVGFEVEKAPGFGRKRHMLQARFDGVTVPKSVTPAWYARPKPQSDRQIAIIGAGVAGTCLGMALTRAGFSPTLIDGAEGPARGASATPAGILIPRLAAEADPQARFYAAAFHQAAELYQKMGVLIPGGALRLPRLKDDVPRLARTLETGLFDPTTTQLLDTDQASHKAGVEVTSPALYFEQGGGVDATGFLIKAQAELDVRYGRRVERLFRLEDKWALLDEQDGVILMADTVVVAAGMATLGLLGDMKFPLVARNGQVSHLATCDAKIPIAHGGYVVPDQAGGAWVGTTHDKVDDDAVAQTSPQADDQIRGGLKHALPGMATDYSIDENWAGIRATSPDFVPIAGPVPDRATYLEDFAPLKNGMHYGLPQAQYRPGLYAMAGLGSRGYVTAPLLAELIAAQMTDTPLPVESQIAQILHPARFLVRELVHWQSAKQSQQAQEAQQAEEAASADLPPE